MSIGNISFIGTKLGMSVLFEGNNSVPVTLVKINPNTVLAKREYNNFSSVMLAGGVAKKKVKINKPQHKLLENANLNNDKEFVSIVREFRVAHKLDSLSVGTQYTVNDSLLNAIVDVRSVSKGKGFQGGIKRWGFGGLPASHGVSLTHRSIGSTGNRSLPGKVFKNKKMPGHMGSRNVCVQNLVIKYVDTENNIVAIAGSIPGGKNASVFITNAKKKFNSAKNILNGLTLS